MSKSYSDYAYQRVQEANEKANAVRVSMASLESSLGMNAGAVQEMINQTVREIYNQARSDIQAYYDNEVYYASGRVRSAEIGLRNAQKAAREQDDQKAVRQMMEIDQLRRRVVSEAVAEFPNTFIDRLDKEGDPHRMMALYEALPDLIKVFEGMDVGEKFLLGLKLKIQELGRRAEKELLTEAEIKALQKLRDAQEELAAWEAAPKGALRIIDHTLQAFKGSGWTSVPAGTINT